jgi:CheY-like chemotaxis protein
LRRFADIKIQSLTICLKRRVLIIDDESEVRLLLNRTLTQAGYEVVAVASGNEGTRACRQYSFDLIIIDMVMPEKDGLETMMEIRRGSPNARIIAMSGAPRAPIMDPLNLAVKLGAVASITKPFTPDEFLGSVLQHLPHAHTQLGAAA